MVTIILSFITAFAITYIAIPSIIRVAKFKHLYDKPGGRKSHKDNVPTLGGLAIFAGLIFSVTFWIDIAAFQELQYIIAALIIVFFVGMKDDIVEIPAYKKFIIQIITAFILVWWGDIRLTSLYGILSVHNIPFWPSFLLSILTIIVIINAFNLIDGIDGLISVIGIIITTIFGIWFYLGEFNQLAVLAFALSGTLIAFLCYNYSPAKIFMGDTGSLLVGFIASILAIKFIELNSKFPVQYQINCIPSVAIGVLIIPLFDTFQVFVRRILKKRSPFVSDKNHLHHRWVKLGLSHMQVTLILGVENVLFILLAIWLQTFDVVGTLDLLLLLFILAYLFMLIPFFIIKKQKRKVN